MRKLLPLLLLIAVGCQHCPRLFDCTSCVEKEVVCRSNEEECPAPRCQKVVSRPRTVCEDPVEKCEQAPQIQVKRQAPIVVKLPPERIVVQAEQPQQQFMPQAQQQFMPQAQQLFMPQALLQPQMVMVPTFQPQSAPAGRARPGLTIDFFRLPIPFPRLIAVPDVPQTMQVAMVPQSFAPQAFAPQSFAPQLAQQSFAPQSFAPQFAQQSFAPQSFQQQQPFSPQAFAPQSMPAQNFQPHAMMSVQGNMNVPVQGSVNVPFQTQVPVPVQSQGFAPQSVAVQPQAMIPQATVRPQAMIPIIPQSAGAQAQPQGISLEQAEAFCRMVEQMKKQMVR